MIQARAGEEHLSPAGIEWLGRDDASAEGCVAVRLAAAENDLHCADGTSQLAPVHRGNRSVSPQATLAVARMTDAHVGGRERSLDVPEVQAARRPHGREEIRVAGKRYAVSTRHVLQRAERRHGSLRRIPPERHGCGASPRRSHRRRDSR